LKSFIIFIKSNRQLMFGDLVCKARSQNAVLQSLQL
jgi:hypothetical protein